jgi:hypothetical protein
MNSVIFESFKNIVMKLSLFMIITVQLIDKTPNLHALQIIHPYNIQLLVC